MNNTEIDRKLEQFDPCSKEWWKIELRSMIDSVWCYHNYKDIDSYMNNKYILDYQNHGLSIEEIKEIVINQVNYLNENCEIEYNVYEDSEGCTYNSIVYKEKEQE